MKFVLIPKDLKDPQPNNIFECPAAKCLKRHFQDERLVVVHDNLIRIGDRFWKTPKEITKYMWGTGEMPMEFELDLNQRDGSPGHEFE